MTLIDKHRHALKIYDRHARRHGRFIQPGPIPPNLPRRLKYWNRVLRKTGAKLAKRQWDAIKNRTVLCNIV